MNLTKEDLQAIKAIIKEETDPINKRLDKIEVISAAKLFALAIENIYKDKKMSDISVD